MPLVDEVVAKGVAYVWSNTRINPVGELIKATVGVVRGKKRIRNLVKIPVLIGGMVGGAYIFVANPWDWALMQEIVSGPVSEVVTGIVGVWVGGSASWTAGKQVLRLWNQVVGGDTNSDYNLSMNNTETIMEAAGYAPEIDDGNDVENHNILANIHPGRSIANNISRKRLPAAVEHRYHCDEACRDIEEFHGVIQYFINLATRYKNDGTSRHKEIKYPLSELLRGTLQPAINFLDNRVYQKIKKRDEAQGVIQRLGVLLNGEDHPIGEAVLLGEREQVRLGNLLQEYSASARPTQYHDLYAKNATKPKVTTWGDVYNLREKAELYVPKQNVEAGRSGRARNTLRRYCPQPQV